jgi:hypothetical protein
MISTLASFVISWSLVTVALTTSSYGDRLRLLWLQRWVGSRWLPRSVEKERISRATLAVVTYYYNPTASSDLLAAYQRLIRQMCSLGLDTYSVEVVRPGDSPVRDQSFHRITVDEPYRPWQRESLINAAVEQLPERYETVAWFDPGITLLNSAWIDESLAVLKEVPVAQLFERALLVNREGRVCSVVPSAGFTISQRLGGSSVNDSAMPNVRSDEPRTWCGGAWIVKRSLFPRSWSEVAYAEVGGRVGCSKGQAVVQLAAIPELRLDINDVDPSEVGGLQAGFERQLPAEFRRSVESVDA